MLNYIVTNKPVLYVRAQMDTRNSQNIKRSMSNGEGFVVHQTYVVNGNQVWGRVSNNPGDVQQEYVCLSIGNRTFAKAEESQPDAGQVNPVWILQVDAFLRGIGYKGVSPF